MKPKRRFAPTCGEFTPESVARFTGIRTFQPKIDITHQSIHISCFTGSDPDDS